MPLQMLLRGRNTVGYTPYPTAVTDAFVTEAAAHRHRHLPHLRRAQRRRPDAPGDRRGARRPAPPSPRSRSATPATCPTPARSSTPSTTTCASPSRSSRPAPTSSPSRTWPGCCAPRPRARWSRRCASGSTCRCTCTPTTPPAASSATLLAAIDAGVDAVDVASAPMAGTTSQPPMSALVAATDGTARATGLDLQAVCDLEPYWEAVRQLYAPFESGLPAPTGRVYTPRDPRRPAVQPAPAGHRARPRRPVRGRSRTCTPRPTASSATSSRSPRAEGRRRPRAGPGRRRAPTRPTSRPNPTKYDIPDSVIGFLAGELGDPPGGWPEPFRTKALAGRDPQAARSPS